MLAGVLAEQVPSFRSYAATKLGEMGPDAVAAVPALKKVTSRDLYRIRSVANEALKKIEGKG